VGGRPAHPGAAHLMQESDEHRAIQRGAAPGSSRRLASFAEVARPTGCFRLERCEQPVMRRDVPARRQDRHGRSAQHETTATAQSAHASANSRGTLLRETFDRQSPGWILE
jgi:hypothetical protein